MNIETLFLIIIDMSISASIVIGLVLIARFLLKRMSRAFSYVLWCAVLFQLLCPVAIESSIGILPPSNLEVSKQVQEYVFDEIALDRNNRDFQKNFLQVDHETDEFEFKTENTMLKGLAILWVVGILGMLVHSGKQVMRLQKRLRTAIPSETDQHIYLLNGMETAFVFGLLRPRIYLPSHIEGEERAYIVAHEQYHIRRLDYVIRFIAFIALAVHWFNPLVWFAFMLAGRDMEMSCDEAVVKTLNIKLRKAYANSLLTMSVGMLGVSMKKII